MKLMGRKSLLFGVHQVLWHPWTVYRAWVYLYGRPTWKEIICIIVHDWGYWFCENMDDDNGQRHPITGANIVKKLFGEEYYYLVLCHSRHYSKEIGREPSKLCWADKLSIFFDPKHFYLFRAKLTGEIKEYRKNAKAHFPLDSPDSEWFDWIRQKFIDLSKHKNTDLFPYMKSND
jgi:hypothetical protein